MWPVRLSHKCLPFFLHPSQVKWRYITIIFYTSIHYQSVSSTHLLHTTDQDIIFLWVVVGPQSSPAFSPLTYVKLEITLSVHRAPPSPNRLVGLTSFCSNLMVRVFLADKAKEDAGNVWKGVGRKHQDEFPKCAGTWNMVNIWIAL